MWDWNQILGSWGNLRHIQTNRSVFPFWSKDDLYHDNFLLLTFSFIFLILFSDEKFLANAHVYMFWGYLLTADPTYHILESNWRFMFVSCIFPNMEISCTVLYSLSVVSFFHRKILLCWWQKRPPATQEYPAFAWFALSAFFHLLTVRTLSTRCVTGSRFGPIC